MSTAAQIAAQAEKAHGTGVARMASIVETGAGTRLPTGIFSLDSVLHGGWPEGQIHMVYGHPSYGKTLVAMRSLASAQRHYPGKTAVMVDVENTYDAAWGAVQGIDNERLLLVRPPSGEVALDVIDGLLRADDVSLVVLDSIPAIQPTGDTARSYEDQTRATRASLMGRFMSKSTQAMLTNRAAGRRTTLLLVNQWRAKMALKHPREFPHVLPGGNAVQYQTSVWLEMLRPEEERGKDAHGREIVLANTHGFKLGKDKSGGGVKSGEFVLIRDGANELGAGMIDDAKAVIRTAQARGMLTGGGGKYRLAGFDDTFRTHDAIASWMYGDWVRFEALKAALISEERKLDGLPAGGWLPNEEGPTS